MKLLLSIFFFFLPLLFSYQTNQVFELPKFTWFLVVGLGVMGIAQGIRVLKERKISTNIFWEQRGLMVWFGLYMAYLVLNTLVSLSPAVSFFGTYERHQGLLFTLGLGFFLLLFCLQKWTREEIHELLYWVVGSGLMAGFTGIFQKLQPDAFGGTASSLGRVFGTMGHPNYLGQYLVGTILLALFLGLYHYLQKKKISAYLSIAAIVQIIALVFTWNRASLAALLFGGVLWLLIALFCLLTDKKKRNLIVGILIIAFAAISVAGGFMLTSLGKSSEQRSVETRLLMVPHVEDAIAVRPWLGYGLDSFGFAFTPFLPDRLGETENFTNVPDKAHNEILDILMEQGRFGMFFLLMYIAVLLIKTRRYIAHNTVENEEKALLMGLWAIFFSLELSYMAGFAVVSNKVFTVLLLFVLLWSISKSHVEREDRKIQLPVALLLGTVLMLVSVTSLIFGVRTFVGDIAYAKSLKNPVVPLQSVLNIAPFPYEYMIFGQDPHSSSGTTIDRLQAAREMNSYDYFVPLQLGRLYGEGKQETEMNAEFAKAAKLCPYCPYTYYFWTYELEKLGKIKDAAKYIEYYFYLVPSFMKKDEKDLTSYEKERRRIFLKENQDEYSYMLEAAKK